MEPQRTHHHAVTSIAQERHLPSHYFEKLQLDLFIECMAILHFYWLLSTYYRCDVTNTETQKTFSSVFSLFVKICSSCIFLWPDIQVS